MTIEHLVDKIGAVVPADRNDRRVLVVMTLESLPKERDHIAALLKERHNLQAEFVYRFRAPGATRRTSEHGVESAGPYEGR